MKKGKRDQRPYELVQQHLSGLILSTILGIVEDLGDPYRAKPGLGGMTAYPPKAMAVVCILMEAETRTYRKMVGHLRMNRGPRHEDRAAQDTLKEHHMARLRHDPRAVPAGGPHEDHRRRHGDRLVGRGTAPATPATGSSGGSASATTRSGSSAAGSSCTASSMSPPGPS